MRLIALVTHTGRRGEKGGEKINKQKKIYCEGLSLNSLPWYFNLSHICKQKVTQLVFSLPFSKVIPSSVKVILSKKKIEDGLFHWTRLFHVFIQHVYMDSFPKRSPGKNELSEALSDEGVVRISRSSEGVDQTELGPVDHGLDDVGPPPPPPPPPLPPPAPEAPQLLSPAELALALPVLPPLPPPLPLPPEVPFPPAPGVEPLTPQLPPLEEPGCCCCCCCC